MKRTWILLIIGLTSCSLSKRMYKTTNQDEKVFPKIVNLAVDSTERVLINSKEYFDITLVKIKFYPESIFGSDILINSTFVLKNQNSKIDTIYPMIYLDILETPFVYSRPIFTNDSLIEISFGIDFHDVISEKYTQEKFDEFRIKVDDSFIYEEFTVTLENLITSPEHKNLNPNLDTISVGANLKVEKIVDGEVTFRRAKPIFFLRDNSYHDIQYVIEEYALIFRFILIDPKTEEFTFRVGTVNEVKKYPIEIHMNK